MRLNYSQKVWYQAAFILLACIPVIVFANYLDTRTLNDIGIWVKPLKFHISTALHLLTFAFLAQFLPHKTATSKWLACLALITAAATIVEMFLIDLQATRGVQSHFNFTTQKDAAIYTLMGVAALILSLPALILGIAFFVVPTSPSLTPGLKLGAALGLTVGFVLTLLIAGYMSSLPSGHWVGAPATDQGGVPIVGWTKQGGDLRVPHFFATHLMQVLPIVGYTIDKVFMAKARHAKAWVVAMCFAGIGLTMATLMQALNGQPFIS